MLGPPELLRPCLQSILLKIKQTSPPCPPKNRLPETVVPHYPIFCLRFPKLSKSIKSSKDLNKKASFTWVSSATLRKELKRNLRKYTRSAVLKVRSTDPWGPETFSGDSSRFFLFQLHICVRQGFLMCFNPISRLQQTEADMRTQLLKRFAN